MATPAKPTVNPIALKQGEGEALWFVGARAIVKASSETTDGRVTVIEHLAPEGSGPPIHVHHREDEWFFVIEGELTFWVGGRIIKAQTGSFVYGPPAIPHTFTVTSPRARSLVVTEPAGFERFMRALDQPPAAHTIPPAGVPLPSRDKIMELRQSSGSKSSARQASLHREALLHGGRWADQPAPRVLSYVFIGTLPLASVMLWRFCKFLASLGRCLPAQLAYACANPGKPIA